MPQRDKLKSFGLERVLKYSQTVSARAALLVRADAERRRLLN